MNARMNAAASMHAAFVWACTLDVLVAKPGNVSVASPGHGMTADLFIASGRAAAGPLCEAGAPVGQRIENAVRASWAAAGCNTNLGIVLLCAPLAAACERCAASEAPPNERALRMALHQVLDQLDVPDAQAAYRAVALANPGGLGKAAQHDIADVPHIDLRRAMVLAADRDRIARQYATGFDDVFTHGLPAFRQGLGERSVADPQGHVETAVVNTFLGWLASGPDSHIVRKHGTTLAQTVTAQAAELCVAWLAGERLASDAALSTWDTQLKTRAINPGTSADLTVATAFAAACLDPSLVAGRISGTVVA